MTTKIIDLKNQVNDLKKELRLKNRDIAVLHQQILADKIKQELSFLNHIYKRYNFLQTKHSLLKIKDIKNHEQTNLGNKHFLRGSKFGYNLSTTLIQSLIKADINKRSVFLSKEQ